MSPLIAALQVARWEFRRYFKMRQQLIGLIIMVVVGGLFWGVARLSQGSPPSVTEIAVLAPSGITLPDEAASLRFAPADASAFPRLLAALEEGDVDGILQLNPDFSGTLTVQRDGAWVADLREMLSEMRRAAVLEVEGIAAATFEDAVAPATIEVVERDAARRGGTYAFVVTGTLMVLAIMAAMGTIFASITGEKQIRVTEQVLSAISPQSWMDGKILGIAGVSLASVTITFAGLALFATLLRLAGVDIPVPAALADFGMLVYLVLFAVLGVLFWLSFLAAVAAIIDDPQTSARGSLMMLPMFSSGVAFFALNDADSTLMRTLALLPPTAPTSMPARLLLGDVHPLEPILALVVLAVAVLLVRLAAGRIFRTAMLMYGKEPSWREIRRWVFARR